MGVKIYKPLTAGRRGANVDSFKDITRQKPQKKLIFIKKKTGGRNVQGKITVRHIGGGEKRYIRVIDFKRDKFDMPAKVISIEYDPNRNARIALVLYSDGEKRYIIAPVELKVDDVIMTYLEKTLAIKAGNAMALERMPIGSMLYNIELTPGKGGQLVRSGGTSAQLMAIEGDYATIKLPSGEIRKVLKKCLAVLGSVSNPDSMNIRLGKAGRKRHMGIKPTVRGKAMNPVDHPHGGGEGKHPIGLKYPKTKWGKHALGVKTRKPQKYSDKMIIQRKNR
ncbi:MAG: 50S ribosomal protein L2 [Candidatus Buchananbacteria bacterium RBG_13_39_9]|uniref:Large ribosomal subunit protein uL2 n=1 Tax=Candidatus Buchananbacteria bacterium RBG_13_39_9 TaxID=1797531 RepID=A0A1G1XNR8_9BACT|nr:MAG: 50S ribosomal protein L2 [Candidatus Buchananbacteria bacterium RBG_13_39_9]